MDRTTGSGMGTLNWQEMSARDRDALIARHVMGLSIERNGITHDLRIDHVITETGRRIAPYSTSMDAAWLVVQRLKEQEKQLSDRQDMTLSRAFMRELGALHDDWGLPVLSFWSLASLTPERICYAACRAIGVLDEAGNVQEQEVQ